MAKVWNLWRRELRNSPVLLEEGECDICHKKVVLGEEKKEQHK